MYNSWFAFILTVFTLVMASYTDAFTYKIPNILTFPMMAMGLFLCGFPFTKESIFRMVFLIIFFQLGRFRMMGMGDLKLCMAVLCLRGVYETCGMLFFGAVLLLFYCAVTKPEDTLQCLKDLYATVVYGKPMQFRTSQAYPFAVFLALGYPLAYLIA